MLARVLAELPVPIDAAVESACERAVLADRPPLRSFLVARDRPLVFMTMRSSFDALLVEAAARAGAIVLFPSPVEDVALESDRVRIITSTRAIVARFVIGADGATGIVAKRGGWPRNLRSIPALEWELEVTAEVLARHAGVARFDFGVVRGGYGWVFPKRDHLTVGVLSCAGKPPDLRAALSSYAGSLDLTPTAPPAVHGSLIPIRPRPGGFSRGRVLLTGDAAGLVDPVLCEGITYAVKSGKSAAAAILDSGVTADPARVGTAYRARLRRHVLPDLRLARLLAPLLYGHEKLRAALFGRYGQKLCELMADVIAGDTSYRALLGKPANYLKLLKGAG